MSNEPKFLVYMHTSPSNKRYIGLTSQTVEERWGTNGKRYERNKHFYSAIQKYGWNNFKHEVIARDLTREEACNLEKKLILKYNTCNSKYGYNHTFGGEGNIPNDETREKLSIAKIKMWQDSDIRFKIVTKLTGHECTDATKQKISIANSGHKHAAPSKLKGSKLPPERILKLQGHTPWNKGYTKETNSKVAQIALKLKGRKVTNESIQKQKASRAKTLNDKGKTMWIHNDSKETIIGINDLERYEQQGWQQGRLDTPQIYINKDGITKKINKAEQVAYLSKGWELGKDTAIKQNVSKSRQIYTWEYDNILFNSAKQLAEYLHFHGFPNIVAATITNLYNIGFEKSPTYKDLAGKIRRYENKQN